MSLVAFSLCISDGLSSSVERSPSDWKVAGLIPNGSYLRLFKIDTRYSFSWPSALERARTGCICVDMHPTDRQVVRSPPGLATLFHGD